MQMHVEYCLPMFTGAKKTGGFLLSHLRQVSKWKTGTFESARLMTSPLPLRHALQRPQRAVYVVACLFCQTDGIVNV